MKTNSAANDNKLTLDDAIPLMEQFKPRARELFDKVDDEVLRTAQELVVDIAIAVGARLSRQGLSWIIDRVKDAVLDNDRGAVG